MPTEKNISIIIPAYNEERRIQGCLESIEAQNIQPYEVIVVDNNCQDNTVAIAKTFPFVRILKEKNQGMIYARTAGLDAATGDILVRIDADVRVPQGWLQRIADFYTEQAHGDCGFTGPFLPDNVRLPRFSGWLICTISFRFNRLLLGHHILFGSNMAIPRHIWQTVRPDLCITKDEFNEDLDIAIHVHRHGFKIVYDPKHKLHIRIARVHSGHDKLWGYLMWWPATLRLHGLGTWPLAYAMAVIAYGTSPLIVIIERIARFFGRSPLGVGD